MIDLRKKGLPNHIEVAGKSYLLNTDFREWLKFGEIIKNDDVNILDLVFVIKDDILLLDVIKNENDILLQLIDFYMNENATPKKESCEKSENIVDYVLDGEYIVSSFMYAYNIDLTNCDMHWHLFKALFIGLPDESKMSQIMSMRSYRKDSNSYDKQCTRLKSLWALPSKNSVHHEEILDEINDEFYNS